MKRRLWSLWDMLEINARPFIECLRIIDALQGVIGPLDGHDGIHRPALAALQRNISDFAIYVEQLGLPATHISVTRLRSQIDGLMIDPVKDGHVEASSWQIESLQDALRDIRSRFHDELENRKFLSLSLEDQLLYSGADPAFGPDVAAKFPECAEDIEEAGKCLALGRNTACAFHLMRAMEPAMKMVAGKLGVTITDKNGIDRNWGQIANDMNPKIESFGKSFPDREKWHEAATLLQSVNIAWRNPTAHPKRTYTDEQAQEVYRAARAFMRHL